MKKFYFLLTFFCLSWVIANSQNVIAGEYFIDTDPGLGKGITVSFSPADTIKSVSVPVSSAGLSVGYHYLYIRVKDSDNHWGNYRRTRFYVYNNDSIKPNYDSVYLVQAEYFIDTIPTPGKGRLIYLPHVDTINYDELIPGLSLDTGLHKVSVRVRDNKGAWSYFKTDTSRTDNYFVTIDVLNAPFTKPGNKEKYSITIKNNSYRSFYDVFLICKMHHADSLSISELPDNINGIDLKNLPISTELNGDIIIPIWLHSLEKKSEKTFDLFLTSAEAGSHEIIENTFELWYDETIYENSFAINGDSSEIQQSKLFNMIYTYYVKNSDSVYYMNLEGSIFFDSLINILRINLSAYKNHPLSHIIKYCLESILNVSINSSMLNNALSQCYFNFDELKYYEAIDSDPDVVELSLKTQTQQCPPACDGPSDICLISKAPSIISNGMRLVADYCQHRCDNGKFKYFHGGWDISMPNTERGEGDDACSTCPSGSNWNNCKSPAFSIYDGVVKKAGPSSNGGYTVVIESHCGNEVFTVWYMHLSSNLLVSEGKSVTSGQQIGFICGSGTDKETGKIIPNKYPVHLHIYYRKPWPSLEKYDPNCFAVRKFYSTIDIVRNKDDCPLPPSWFQRKTVENINSNDPNDKTGNKGYSTPQYVSKDEQLHYGILFKNKDSASASAQVVIIKDTLDKNKIDVNSLRIESVTAGEMLIILPDSVHIQNLDTVYTKQPINGTYVHVQTTFDTSLGILEFKMTSLDTLTLQPVTDPLAGFLPPDTTNFDGNGLVSFKVMPKSTIANGTVIYNTAHIIFDKNPAIATGTWFNTIDNKAPSSYVKALLEITYDTSFTVSWKGTDSGAGIIYYDIYSKNKSDTAYTKWLSATSDTSATFTGQLDSTYQFYSIAYDSLLNVETAPDTSDAITTISSEVLPLTLVSFNANCTQSTVSLEWVTANEIGIRNFSVEKSMNGADWISTEKLINPRNSQLQNQYKFSDTYNGYNYYRLRITENDGNNTYSSVLKINCGKIVNSMQAYPVPARDLLNILIQSDKAATIYLSLTDMYGRVVKKLSVHVQNGINSYSMNTNNLSNAQYILRAEGAISLNTQKIIISH